MAWGSSPRMTYRPVLLSPVTDELNRQIRAVKARVLPGANTRSVAPDSGFRAKVSAFVMRS
jgi:hypothetical protein